MPDMEHTVPKKIDSCTKKSNSHPDHGTLVPKLNRIEGQISGIKKMIEDRRYCPEIIQQVRAAKKALASVEILLLDKHINHCVLNAVDSKDKVEREKKIQEVLDIIRTSAKRGLEL